MPAIHLATLIAVLNAPANDAPRFADIKLSTGVRLHYAEQGPATGTPMILLHGYSDSWFSYSLVLSALSRDRRVYALDLRGHGNSDRPASGYAMRDLADDVIAFMDAKAIARATIVGHSMGGFVAQQVALAAPRRVSALVLMGTGVTPVKFNGLDEFEKAVKELSDPIPDAFAREFQMSTIQMPVSQAFVDRAVAESLKLPARVWRQLMVGLTTYEPAVDLARAGIPTLVIHGLKDPWVPAEQADSLAVVAGAKRIIKYPDAGHAMHWEQPAAVSRDVLAFLAEASGGRR